MPEFHETPMGRDFYDGTAKRISRSLVDIAFQIRINNLLQVQMNESFSEETRRKAKELIEKMVFRE